MKGRKRLMIKKKDFNNKKKDCISFQVFNNLLHIHRLQSVIDFLSLLQGAIHRRLHTTDSPERTYHRELFLLLLFPISV